MQFCYSMKCNIFQWERKVLTKDPKKCQVMHRHRQSSLEASVCRLRENTCDLKHFVLFGLSAQR